MVINTHPLPLNSFFISSVIVFVATGLSLRFSNGRIETSFKIIGWLELLLSPLPIAATGGMAKTKRQEMEDRRQHKKILILDFCPAWNTGVIFNFLCLFITPSS